MAATHMMTAVDPTPEKSDKPVVHKVGWTAPWGRWDYLGGGGAGGGPSDHVVRLFTIKVTLD
jgi:hypothetical protein